MPYIEASVRSGQIVGAARRVMERDGVAAASLRAIATEADVPLGTLQYVFPSKEALLRAVIEDVVDDIAEVLRTSVEVDQGLAHAIGQGVTSVWSHLVAGHLEGQLMQGELLHYALRTPGQADVARRQYRRYQEVMVAWCREAADRAGEVTGISLETLGRLLLAGFDGLILQYASDPDDDRARADLRTFTDMVVAAADIRPA